MEPHYLGTHALTGRRVYYAHGNAVVPLTPEMFALPAGTQWVWGGEWVECEALAYALLHHAGVSKRLAAKMARHYALDRLAIWPTRFIVPAGAVREWAREHIGPHRVAPALGNGRAKT